MILFRLYDCFGCKLSHCYLMRALEKLPARNKEGLRGGITNPYLYVSTLSQKAIIIVQQSKLYWPKSIETNLELTHSRSTRQVSELVHNRIIGGHLDR